MARTSMEQKAYPKADYIAKCAKIDPDKVIGILMRLWNHSQDQGIEVVNREWLNISCFCNTRRKKKQDALLKEFITHRFLEKIGDDAYRIKGNAKHNSSLAAYKNKMKFARQAKAKKQENVKGFNDNGYHFNDDFNESDANLCFETALHKHENSVFGETRGVVHSYDSKALPAADSKNKTKHVEFEKTSMDRTMDLAIEPSMDRILLQIQCTHESESDSSSLNFNKKEKEEKLIEASTNFVYEEKASAIDENFDEARYRYMKKFELIVDFEIRPSQMDKLRYSQLIKSGITPSQVLTMIDNYADYKLPQCKPGHYPIHRKFETFLGSPVNWVCKEYLESMADKVKAKRAAAQKAEDAETDRKIMEKMKSRRSEMLRKQASQALEIEAAIKARANETRTQEQIAVDALGAFVLDIPFSDPKGLQEAGDILNRMNLKI